MIEAKRIAHTGMPTANKVTFIPSPIFALESPIHPVLEIKADYARFP